MRSSDGKSFRVLALDGGGMRGLYTAAKLRRLSALFDQRFLKEEPDLGAAFDLICGTSTGSILACGLASGNPLSKVCTLYIDHGAKIFPRPQPAGRRRLLWWFLRHLCRPSGNAGELRRLLEEQFGTETLGELHGRRCIGLCIPAVDVEAQKSVVIKTPHIPGKHRDNDWSLVNACLASSAAPAFLPIHQMEHPSDPQRTCTFVDGGLWANTPVMIGLIEALYLTNGKRPIEIVSVGTTCGSTARTMCGRPVEWGFARWLGGIRMLEYSMAAQASGHGFMAGLTAEALNRAGMDIRIIRMPEAPKSPEETAAIGLDRTDRRAVQTLLTLAAKDAEQFHSDVHAHPNDPRHATVRNIFSEIKPL